MAEGHEDTVSSTPFVGVEAVQAHRLNPTMSKMHSDKDLKFIV